MSRRCSALPRAPPPSASGALTAIAAFSEKLDKREELREIVETAPADAWRDATLMSLDLDLRGAAEIFASMPSPTLAARMRLHASAHLIETGRRAEGETELESALVFYRSVEAAYYIERAETLLAQSAQRESA